MGRFNPGGYDEDAAAFEQHRMEQMGLLVRASDGGLYPNPYFQGQGSSCKCHEPPKKPIKVKPWTKKEKAEHARGVEALKKDLALTFHKDPKVREEHFRQKMESLRKITEAWMRAEGRPVYEITPDGKVILKPEKKRVKRKATRRSPRAKVRKKSDSN